MALRSHPFAQTFLLAEVINLPRQLGSATGLGLHVRSDTGQSKKNSDLCICTGRCGGAAETEKKTGLSGQ